MPRPKTPKEIKQFLGLCDYYRKFVPRFSDIARPLSKLTPHDTVFVWCEQCELSFQMLKDTLVSAPILKYPDTSKPYNIFTDASKYGWAGVLTQEHISVVRWKGDYYKASSCVCKWSISGQSIKLGCYDQGSICNIHDH